MCPPSFAALDYADPSTRPTLPPAWRAASFRVAVACWAVPLAVGVAIYLGSEVARATAPAGVPMMPSHGGPPPYRPFALLTDAGLLTIAGGTAAAVLAVAALVTFAATRWSATVDRRRQVILPTAVVTLLVASNFVVALILTGLATRS